MRLPPRVRDLQIDYTALSLVVPEKVHFRYKLEGQDQDWREVVNDRQAQYSNLPPRPTVPRDRLQQQRRMERRRRDAGLRDPAGLVPDELVPRRLCGRRFLAIALGRVPTPGAATGGAIQHASGRARRRAHTDCSGPARHAFAKFSRSGASVFRGLSISSRIVPRKHMKFWRAR